ncbi:MULTISPECIES: tRNA (adenosine(37)-N6)-threonylcarbamoyltransferase complex dimerization subunit type 1 TsaB [unclassified Plantibacter]|uniref:tRNA (adenosine(37)-N6)-threonylcarbamoyltransferase complex dimerization subunit type 1 TsaB n=1 Tax=unclassified Plantibacter TaxID=2624265 RepID=UPI003D3373D5
MLLAIDTSAGSSVAITDPVRGVLAERSSADTMRHAEVIGRLIHDCLQEAGVAVSELDGVVAGMGPGPFTGLRIGIAAARAFAIGAGLPVLPVVSHDAIALSEYRDGRSEPLLVVTDARRRERYWTAYSGLDASGLPVRIDGPGLGKPDELPHPELLRIDAETVSAASLGVVAELLRAGGHPFASDEPLYLRSPDVTLSPKKRVTG